MGRSAPPVPPTPAERRAELRARLAALASLDGRLRWLVRRELLREAAALSEANVRVLVSAMRERRRRHQAKRLMRKLREGRAEAC